ncbi:MAG: type I restriction enzyme HsdR N-terminal domain-containing protein [Proteobacteria bacterium]|nr:type I restriction enzyme HsdR N-terminal domain-containing protein [Pseudomonadota bacterium]
MYKIGIRARTRMAEGLKQLLPVIATAKARDVNEANTVTIITDAFEKIFGYDRYNEITAEYKIRSTYCDLAIKMNGNIQFLIEVKAIGIDLKSHHARQAVDYGSRAGVEWVILTNGVVWDIYRIIIKKSVDFQKISSFNLMALDHHKDASFIALYPLCREGIKNNAILTLANHHKVMNQYSVSALLLSPPVLRRLRIEANKIFKEIAVTNGSVTEVDEKDIKQLLLQDIIKRAITDSDELDIAKSFLSRTYRKIEKRKSKELNKQPPTNPVSNLVPKIVDLDLY